MVELIIGLFVTTVLLGALAALLYTVNDRFSGWGTRIDTASNGFALASALQTDSHRYVVQCSGAGTQLVLHSSLGSGEIVTYGSSQSGSGWVVTRTVNSGTAQTLGRLDRRPTFAAGQGAIRVSNIGTASDMVVYYRPLAGQFC